ncbi:Sec-independent protein translocase TatC [Quadrisphaera granulorum]|uniref:Sec-independent protein translocase protein TatC n=1 Tax=Quadrisphaera granulorum TaxID=317664 RepID=A0A316A8A6_9ACTN|nr:twin-arginine translocase subunit TatC [Quadrisphaera granulorum]PWJ53190.1 Sec-independent protein translocase TatC [Quadrisphaera granulorum]SZE97122.1 Sec-independent protein translocase TatC [Quadrisphaera granulorum]
MPLREHLLELRKRVTIAGIAVLLGSVAGWFLYDPVLDYLTAPIEAAKARGLDIAINFQGVGTPFDLKLKLSVWIGFIVSSPVWIYQLWAFVTPGLTKKERRYALGFMSAAVPLFLAGVWLSSLFIPNVVSFFTSFTPSDGANIIAAEDYLGFVMRTVLVFGCAFLLPVVLVGLNLLGLLSGKAVLKAWRWVTVLCFLFAAIATPTPDVVAMFTLATPMLLLFAVAIGICLLNDKRRAKREPQYGDLADDEASAL